jgi:bacteriorhodopsin
MTWAIIVYVAHFAMPRATCLAVVAFCAMGSERSPYRQGWWIAGLVAALVLVLAGWTEDAIIAAAP